MPKFFDRIAELNPLDDVSNRFEESLRRGASAITPNAIERRVPSAFKDFAAETATGLGLPFSGLADPGRTLRYLRTVLNADHEVGLQLAQLLLPKRFAGIPLEGIGAEVLRPSNLVPVSKATTLLKAGRFGRPLVAELGKEAL